MESENVVCPVCTLFLRPGITLKSHLTSHPKHKVIEALVRLSNPEGVQKSPNTTTSTTGQNETVPPPQWSQTAMPVNAVQPNFGALPGNHSFIYQQFMSSSTPQPNVLQINPLTQQVVTIPAVFNSQMMCPPYVYQQQQVIMSSGPSAMPMLPRPLPIELPESPHQNVHELTSSGNDETTVLRSDSVLDVDSVLGPDMEPDEPDLVTVEIRDDSETTVNVKMMPKCEDMIVTVEKKEVDLTSLGSSNEATTDVKEVKKQDDVEINCEDIVLIEASHDDEINHDLQSPCSNSCDDWAGNDLDKSCQTQNNNYSDLDQLEPTVDECKPSCYYTDTVITKSDYAILQNSYSQNEPTYTMAESHNESVYAQESANLMDMDGMNLLISNEFLTNPLVSQVEDFECVSSERPRVLMNIGGMEATFTDHRDESLSTESANVRADEHMPPRGELSGQESNGGTSDLNWNRVQYHDGSCGMSVSYDLIARETWDGSDVSDSEAAPAEQPHNPHSPPPYVSYENDDTPTVSGFIEPPITYKCPTCSESFNCPKERRVHQKERHDKSKSTGVAAKRVKKLTIKPKRAEIKTENNFDNVFTNKLKIEANLEMTENFDRVSVVLPPTDQIEVQKTEDLLVNNPLVCTICNTVVSDNNSLKMHQMEVHKFPSDIKHKCSTCGESFPNEIKYTEHLKVHPLECRLCGKYFYRRPNMQLHMKRHLGIKPYKCSVCGKAFLTKQKHDEHKNIHTGDAPIKCTLCDETFRRHSNLVQHRNRHHFNLKKKLKDYVCFCGEICHSKKKLAWHKEIHDAKPKGCSQCSEKFIHLSSLTRHVRRAHNERFVPKEERIVENVECPICKGIYLRSSLEVHIRNHSGQRPYTCLICNKDFTTKWNLKLHKWTHASRTSKPFRCDQCKGAFIRESDYVAHMNSHKSVKPYTCNYCGAQFIRKYNCQRHVREHEKVKTFSCQVCGKCFHRSYYLKDHMRVHSGLRPYACHICGKTSTTKSNHNKHVRIHHAREPVSTEN